MWDFSLGGSRMAKKTGRNGDETVSAVARELKRLRTEAGITVSAMGRALGKGTSGYQHYEDRYKRQYLPPEMRAGITRMLTTAGISKARIDALFGPTGLRTSFDDQNSYGDTAPTRTRKILSAIPLERDSLVVGHDLPVVGQVKAGAEGEGFFLDNGMVQQYVERPWFFAGSPDAFAVYVHDDSMEPALKHGHLLYVDPARATTPGDEVVVELNDGQAFVKRLVRRTQTVVILRQFNPEKEISISASEVKRISLVVADLRVRI